MDGEVLAGRYRLVGLLGRGGAGEVWRAEDLRLGRPVAVKLLHRLDGDRVSAVDRFRSEARAAARLSHPNVVTTYDAGIVAGRAFLVMELVAGRDLAQLLRGGARPTPAQVSDVAGQASRALDAAHAAGIVHRDVKPGNLLLAPDGAVKITDFGIATAVGPHDDTGRMLLGTPAYIAPEQVRGEPATPASDRYALGCVLYELLAGSPPFAGPDAQAVLDQHVHAEPVPIQERRPDVGSGLGTTVMRLLAKDPAARPASAAEVVSLLAGGGVPQTGDTRVIAPADLPPEAQGDPAPEGLPRPHRRPTAPRTGRRVAMVAGALTAAAVVAVLLQGATSDPDPRAAPDAVRAARPTPTPTRAVATRATPTPRPTPTATPTPKPTAPPTTRPTDPAATLRTLARLLRADDGRGSRTTRQAARELDRAAARIADGDAEEAAGMLRRTLRDLAEAQRDDRWEPTPRVATLLRQVGRALPPAGSDGDSDGDSRGDSD